MASLPARQKPAAFTLIELLVVISIIALLISLLLPALGEARRQVMVVKCAMNLKSYAMGLTVYATDEGSGQYPPHSLGNETTARSLWGEAPGFTFFPDTYGSSDPYLAMFRDVICGGDMQILWCPLHTYHDNPLRPEVYLGQTDPDFPDLWYEESHNNYYAGYWRFANMFHPLGDDGWTQSGNSRTDGPPTGPGSSQDAILADPVYSERLGPTPYADPHLNWMWVSYDDGLRTRRENNVAYSDGHVEAHAGQAFIDDAGYLMWEGAHYVPRGNGERWVY
jgi:prepilin-type N-terminal cleavage/methylation domain-containing protein/prepilin-type processing-associated H-X9-DG protein